MGAALAAAMSVSLAPAQTQREPSSLVQIQEAQSEIHLIVFDASGAVIPTAKVVLTVGGKQIAEGATNGSGQLRLKGLAPGQYDLTIKCLGFETWMAKNLVVVPRQTRDVKATLQVGKPVFMGEISASYVETQPSPLEAAPIPELVVPRGPGESIYSTAQPSEQPQSRIKKFLHALGHALNH
jgi:hypothetical protein